MGSIDLCDVSKRTVCELNCRLVHVEAGSADIPGVTYPCVQLTPCSSEDNLLPLEAPVYIRGYEPNSAWLDSAADKAVAVTAPLHAPLRILYNWMLGYGLPFSGGIRPAAPAPSGTRTSAPPPPPAWHPHASTLAVADSNACIHVYDMPSGDRGQAAGSGVVSEPRCRLSHPLQPAVWALAWRPCRGSQLAVGTTGGVVVWSTGGSGRPPLATRSGGGRGSGPWLLLLQSRHKTARYTALAWCPLGRLLASSCPDTPGVTVWDVAAGTSTQVGAGLAAITLLRWSPCGAYLLGAGVGSRFHLWETSSWSFASWDVPTTLGPVVQAAWAPLGSGSGGGGVAPGSDGGGGGSVASRRVVLLSFAEGGGGMVALHLVKEPPSLAAQMMPVVLPDITLKAEHPPQQAAADGGAPGGSEPAVITAMMAAAGGAVVQDWAWDVRGERLGVLLGAPHPAAGCLAVYATSVDPVVHARLLGYARPPPSAAGAGQQASGKGGAVSAHNAFSAGALFTVRMAGQQQGQQQQEGGEVLYNLPMHFK